MKPTWCTFHSIYWESMASTWFRALLAHPQEVLHKRHLVYCVRIMSVGCGKVAVHCKRATANWPNVVCVAPPEDEQVMLETCRGSWFSINWMKSVSRWFHYTLQSWHSQLTLYLRNIPIAVCVDPPEDEQVMLETCRGPWFSINWIKSASRWFHYTDRLYDLCNNLISV
jgi:hypothetical protein